MKRWVSLSTCLPVALLMMNGWSLAACYNAGVLWGILWAFVVGLVLCLPWRRLRQRYHTHKAGGDEVE